MFKVAFFDSEVDYHSKKILDLAAVKFRQGIELSFHSSDIRDFISFVSDIDYLCGHNIINHDLKYLSSALERPYKYIDTLFLSPLLFPKKPYHKLVKDDKLQSDEVNNPLNDSKKARDLFFSEVDAFKNLSSQMQEIFYRLLIEELVFAGFFAYLTEFESLHFDFDKDSRLSDLIMATFDNQICFNVELDEIIKENPIELAYTLALISCQDRYSITPAWVTRNYPSVERIMYLLRAKACLEGCSYCHDSLDSKKALKRFFGYDSYRTYAGENLQEDAVRAALADKSLLAVFPTGGGKSITFQIPALVSGENVKGLTVVISPLQSLMKDQVDNLERHGIIEAVTINGLLDPIERAKAIERVSDGSASILYIAPESLRSKTIENLILSRNLVRFVIDEAHCFSSWGQDFRVDYLYIGDFIKSIQEQKNLSGKIPVSCFTATAKQKVIADIRAYFREKLDLEMELFTSSASRTNLSYRVLKRDDDEEKYRTIRDLIEEKACPTIIYVSRTRTAWDLAKRLVRDGYEAKAYHGKMEKQEKSQNQDAFINGEIDIMVATSAFGMGVDKSDVGLVIHYEISDSLENYVQEAGRAGRDQSITGECYVLYTDNDLDKHFILLNQTKMSIKEIQQIWRAIKEITRYRSRVSQSTLEIARKAGWDENVSDIDTRVRTAITALEDSGYLKRGHNIPRIYANSIMVNNMAEAREIIDNSKRFNDKQKSQALRIISKLLSAKRTKDPQEEEAETRVDHISDHLGIVKEDVIRVINFLREEKILADAKDLVAFIKTNENKNRSLAVLESYREIEKFLISKLKEGEDNYHLKELNQEAEEQGCYDVNPSKIRRIINYWGILKYIKRNKSRQDKDYFFLNNLLGQDKMEEKFESRIQLANFIVNYLYTKLEQEKEDEQAGLAGEEAVEFSVLELKISYEYENSFFNLKTSLEEIEDTLYYLSRIEALKLDGGFLVIHNALLIERLELDNKIQYKIEDYKKLKEFYEQKIQQIHIVGEYAKIMLTDYKAALEFVDDYFRLNYSFFLKKYFKGSRKDEISKNISPKKFRELFGSLSPTQLKIIKDNQSKYILVAAGPGSGKTRVLVHKLASLMIMEDVKHEQMLMLTFSRSAAIEFKKRLMDLIGNATSFIDIMTFHSYCFDLLGQVGSIDKSAGIISRAIASIEAGEIEPSKITKTVLVIDEAQDMDANEFLLVQTLMNYNENMRIIAVGDDDQNIYEFRGSNSKYMTGLLSDSEGSYYELVENYRSRANIVNFANQYASRIKERLKRTDTVAVSSKKGRIERHNYSSRNLVRPLVNYVMNAELAGTTCIMTKSNDEAAQIAGILVKEGLPAKLIQTNDGFNLYDLMEIRFFIWKLDLDSSSYIIDESIWQEARREFVRQFKNSRNSSVCLNLIADFEFTNPKLKRKSDFLIFIKESSFEDYIRGDNEVILVSTIHKSKGREFDNVILMLDEFYENKEEAKRQLYVGITRAKENLIIHYNGNYLDKIITDGLEQYFDNNSYQLGDELAVELSLKDVWLDKTFDYQEAIRKVVSGDNLIVREGECYDQEGRKLLDYSKRFQEKIKNLERQSYYAERAVVDYIILWSKEEEEVASQEEQNKPNISKEEVRVMLPTIYFKRREEDNS